MSLHSSGNVTDDDERDEKLVIEEVEYKRMDGSVPKILSGDIASCITVAEFMIALGTHAGSVHILDLLGNQIKEFRPHTATVNDLCFDTKGEYLGSCSNNGSIVINSLLTNKEVKLNYDNPVMAIALNPDYARNSSSRFVVGGLTCGLYINRKGWISGYSDQVIHSGGGPICVVKWRTSLIAWADNVEVGVYDTASDQVMTIIERPSHGSPLPMVLLHHLVWQDDSLLVIAWVTSVKIALIKTYIPGEDGEKEISSSNLSRQGNAQRLEVHVVTWKNHEFATDALSITLLMLRSQVKIPIFFFKSNNSNCEPLSVGSSYADGQSAIGDEPLCYILTLKDVIIAKLSRYVLQGKPLAAVEAEKGHSELFDKVLFSSLNIFLAVSKLMKTNCEKAVSLLMQHKELITPSNVGLQLTAAEDGRYLLHRYLHSLFKANIFTGRICHEMQVGLYAEYDLEMLFPFLQSSQYYTFETAYQICRSKGLMREEIVHLERMGDPKGAVRVLINALRIERTIIQWPIYILECKKSTKLIIILSIHDQANVHENKTSTYRDLYYIPVIEFTRSCIVT
ncbi:Vacuolar protein sorting-associated protein 41-like protein [Heracleum sosnowskyi]|uniref:Vacuolar protein sorting-associated protein 41-like protein n=1 Tax=Heracleum sosnowskyi TaxID=360622 RepID=A0AAD8MSR3_9APIA|nr:Vacuolar protein sorting-associated protein 41-like protein [Heracleum sosnowskyi]